MGNRPEHLSADNSYVHKTFKIRFASVSAFNQRLR